MSEHAMQVEILSPSRVVSKLAATQLTAPGVCGYMGILPGHAPLIAELDIGELTVEAAEGGTPHKYFVGGGFLEVHEDRTRVLVDVIEKPHEIDRERAQKARARALGRLDDKSVEIDMERAQQALKRADARLAFLESIANLRMA